MVKQRTVYLDYSATTPVNERVLEAMLPYFSTNFGNTSSGHQHGRDAESALETSRETVARILNCKPSEVIFTSGGTESDNLAIRGIGWTRFKQGQGNHLITTPVEHHAVGHTIEQLAESMGFEQTILPVDEYGLVDVEAFATACKENSTIASIIYANNEIGSISPLLKLSEQAHKQDVLLHTDAVQAAGQLTLDVQKLGVDLLSISAHKFYGPKGVGALYCRDGLELTPPQTGGSHESGRRPGTVNTPGVVGLAKALELAYAEQDLRVKHFTSLRDQLITDVLNRVPGSALTGHPTNRLPSHASFILDGMDSSKLIMHLDMRGVRASGGSACKTGNPEPSSVLQAMGYSDSQASSGLRLSVGLHTTEADIEHAVDALVDVVAKIRKLSAVL